MIVSSIVIQWIVPENVGNPPLNAITSRGWKGSFVLCFCKFKVRLATVDIDPS